LPLKTHPLPQTASVRHEAAANNNITVHVIVAIFTALKLS